MTTLTPTTIACSLRRDGFRVQRHKDHVTVETCKRPELVRALDRAFPAQQFEVKRDNEQWEVKAR